MLAKLKPSHECVCHLIERVLHFVYRNEPLSYKLDPFWAKYLGRTRTRPKFWYFNLVSIVYHQHSFIFFIFYVRPMASQCLVTVTNIFTLFVIWFVLQKEKNDTQRKDCECVDGPF